MTNDVATLRRLLAEIPEIPGSISWDDIDAMRNALPGLLDRIEELEAENEQLKSGLRDVAKGMIVSEIKKLNIDEAHALRLHLRIDRALAIIDRTRIAEVAQWAKLGEIRAALTGEGE